MKESTKKTLKRAGIFLLALFFIYGFSAFWVGWHNLDTAQNFDKVNCITEQYGISFNETSLNYKSLDMLRVYIIGSRQMFIGFYTVLFTSFFLGRKLRKTW